MLKKKLKTKEEIIKKQKDIAENYQMLKFENDKLKRKVINLTKDSQKFLKFAKKRGIELESKRIKYEKFEEELEK